MDWSCDQYEVQIVWSWTLLWKNFPNQLEVKENGFKNGFRSSLSSNIADPNNATSIYSEKPSSLSFQFHIFRPESGESLNLSLINCVPKKGFLRNKSTNWKNWTCMMTIEGNCWKIFLWKCHLGCIFFFQKNVWIHLNTSLHLVIACQTLVLYIVSLFTHENQFSVKIFPSLPSQLKILQDLLFGLQSFASRQKDFQQPNLIAQRQARNLMLKICIPLDQLEDWETIGVYYLKAMKTREWIENGYWWW